MPEQVRISATQLDGWRYFLSSDLPEDEYIEQLRGKREATPAMRRGTAFHRLMEFAAARREGSDAMFDDVRVMPGGRPRITVDNDRYTFRLQDGVELQTWDGETEVRGKRAIPELDIVLTGRADVVGEGYIVDYKTQERALDIERYYESLQWRVYLLLFEGIDRFIYQWYRVKQAESDTNDYSVTITDAQHFDQYRYGGLAGDVLSVAHEFAEWRRARGLAKLW